MRWLRDLFTPRVATLHPDTVRRLVEYERRTYDRGWIPII